MGRKQLGSQISKIPLSKLKTDKKSQFSESKDHHHQSKDTKITKRTETTKGTTKVQLPVPRTVTVELDEVPDEGNDKHMVPFRVQTRESPMVQKKNPPILHKKKLKDKVHTSLRFNFKG